MATEHSGRTFATNGRQQAYVRFPPIADTSSAGGLPDMRRTLQRLLLHNLAE